MYKRQHPDNPISRRIIERYNQQAVIATAKEAIPELIKLIRKQGLNTFGPVNISDEEEYYDAPTPGPSVGERRDLAWLNSSNHPEDRKAKMAMIAVASRFFGHGTAATILKTNTGQSNRVPCSTPLITSICDCFRMSAKDMGRGRGNPKLVCIGHPCFGIILDRPADEFSVEEREQWVENNGCELGAECPQGFCVHIAGTAGLDVQFFQRLVNIQEV